MAQLRDLVPNYAQLLEQGVSQDEVVALARNRATAQKQQPQAPEVALLSLRERDAKRLENPINRYGAAFGEEAMKNARGWVGKPANYMLKSEETPYAKALRENNVPLDTKATLPDNFVNPVLGWDEQMQTPTLDAPTALGAFGQTALDAKLEGNLNRFREMQRHWEEANPEKVNVAGEFGAFMGAVGTDPTSYVALPVASWAKRIPAMFVAGGVGGGMGAWGGDENPVTGAAIGAGSAVVFGEVLWGLSKMSQKIGAKLKNNLKNKEALESNEAKVLDAEARAKDEDGAIKAVSESMPDASPEELRTVLNAQRKVLPEDRELAMQLNDGEKVADEMSGMRLLQRLRNTIDAGMMSENELASKLAGYGIRGEYKQKTLEAYRKKDHNILADWIYMRQDEIAQMTGATRLDDAIAKIDEGAKELKTQDVALEALESHPRYDELLQMREGISAKDSRYSQVQAAKGALNREREYVGGNLYEKNYNADFELTSRDVKALREGTASLEQIEKAKRDLHVLDNDPKWGGDTPSDTVPHKDQTNVGGLKESIPEGNTNINTQLNDNGELVDSSGRVLFANGTEPLAGGFLGGADSLINERDYDNDGEYTYKDLLYAVATGAISATALRRLAPKLFETPRGGQKVGAFMSDAPDLKDIPWDKLSKKEASKMVRILHAIPSNEGKFKPSTIIKTNEGEVKVSDLFALKEQKHLDNPNLRGMVTTSEAASFPKVSKNVQAKEGFQGTTWNAKANDGSDIVYGAKEWGGDNNLITIHSKTEAGTRGQHASNVSSGNINDTVSIPPSSGKIIPQNSLHVNEPLPKGTVRVDGDVVETRLLSSPTRAQKKALKRAGFTYDEATGTYKSTHPDAPRIAEEIYTKQGGEPLAQKEAAIKAEQTAQMETLVNETPINSTKEASELLDKSVKLHGGIAEPIWRATLAPLKKLQEAAIKRFDALGKVKARVEQARVEKISQATFRRLTQIDPKSIKESGFYDGVVVQSKTTVDAPSMNAETTLQAPKQRFEVVVNKDGSKDIYRVDTREVFDESLTNLVKTNFFDNYDPEFVKMIHMRNAGEMNSLKRTNEIFETLQKELKEGDSKALVQALDGDLDPTALSPSVAKLYAATRKLIDERAKILVDLGLLRPEDVKGDYVRRFYAEHVERQGFLDGVKEMAWKRDKKGGGGDGQHKRKDMSLEEREGLGQVFNAPYVIAETMALQERQIIKGIFYDDVAKRFGATEQLKGYAQVPDKKQFGKLAGKYVPSHVKFSIVDAPEYMGAMTKLYREAFSHWKVNKTVKNPFTHVYNVGSNVELMMLSHTDPAHLARQVQNGNWKEVVALAERHGMIDDARLMYDLYEGVKLDKLDPSAKGNQAYSALKTLFKNAYMTEDSATGKGMRWAYSWGDKIFKIARMQHNLFNAKKAIYEAKHGEVALLSDEIFGGVRKKIDAIKLSKEAEYEAFREANALFVDYQKPLPPAWETLNRYAIPFLQFSVKSTPVKIRLMLQNPLTAMSINFMGGGIVGRAAAGGAAYAGYQETADFITKYFDADIDRQAHYEWMRPNEIAGVEFDNVLGIVPWRPLPMFESEEHEVYFNQGRLVQGMRGDMLKTMLDLGFPGMLSSYATGVDGPRGRAFRDKDDSTFEKVEKTARKMAQDLLPPPWGVYASKYAEAFVYGENLYGEMMGPADVTLQTLGFRRVHKANAEKRAQDAIQAKIRKVTNVDRRVAAVQAQRTKYERTGGATGYSERRANEQLEKIHKEAKQAQQQLVKLNEDAKRVQGWSGYDSINPPRAPRSGFDIGMPKKMIDLGF